MRHRVIQQQAPVHDRLRRSNASARDGMPAIPASVHLDAGAREVTCGAGGPAAAQSDELGAESTRRSAAEDMEKGPSGNG